MANKTKTIKSAIQLGSIDKKYIASSNMTFEYLYQSYNSLIEENDGNITFSEKPKIYLLKSIYTAFKAHSILKSIEIDRNINQFKIQTINELYPNYYKEDLRDITKIKSEIFELEKLSEIDFIRTFDVNNSYSSYNKLKLISEYILSMIPEFERLEKEKRNKSWKGYVIAFLIPIVVGLILYGVKIVYENISNNKDNESVKTEITKPTDNK
jgi:hypothetical protein